MLKTGDPDACFVKACTANEAFGALRLKVFRLEIVSPETNRGEFEFRTEIVGKIPFWSVSYGNDYNQLPNSNSACFRFCADYHYCPGPFMSHSKYRAPKSVLARTVGTETILFDLQSSSYYSLNEAGRRFWKLVQEDNGVEQILSTMTEEFELDRPTLRVISTLRLPVAGSWAAS